MQNHTDRGAVLKSSFFKGKTALTEKAKGSTAETHFVCAEKGKAGWDMAEYVIYCHASGVLSGKIL